MLVDFTRTYHDEIANRRDAVHDDKQDYGDDRLACLGEDRKSHSQAGPGGKMVGLGGRLLQWRIPEPSAFAE